MRTSIYIEGDVIQLVLTPDNEWEKKALGSFHDKAFTAQFFNGSFYDCRGGWTRQQSPYRGPFDTMADDASLILRAEPASTQPPSEGRGG